MVSTNKGETLDRLELTGEARERGLTHGESYADEIEANLERYLTVFDHYGAGRDTVYDQAAEFAEIIEEGNPEYFTEMAAVASGAGLDTIDVTVLNARWEVMYSVYAETAEGNIKDTPPDGCTAFGAQPEITANGHTIIGQNWDWRHNLDIFVMDIRRDDGPNMVAMTEAGIVGGKIGINEHGIGMVQNGLVAEGDGEEPFRKPYHVRFREALDSKHLHGAIQSFIETDRANSANVLLAHSTGEMIDLELAPTTEHHLYPDDGLLTHANHFEKPGNVKSKFERIAPSTLCRGPRLNRLLSKKRGEIDVEGVQECLQDHFGRPNSICKHVDEESPEPERSRTNGSFVLNLEERLLHGTYGPPCMNEYRTFEVGT